MLSIKVSFVQAIELPFSQSTFRIHESDLVDV